jgi:hypothetical protein
MELKIKKINGVEFQTFVKKLLSIDKFIFMKLAADQVTSSVYLPQKDAVKFTTVKTSEMFEIEEAPTAPIKISFFNGNKVIDALSFFGEEISAKVSYQKIGDDLVATDFTVEDENLKINLYCADPSLNFMEMTDDEIKRAFGANGKVFSFELLTVHVDKMKSLFKLEDDRELFKFKVSEKGVHVSGDRYDAVLTHQVEIHNEEMTEVSMYKKYIPILDKENYKVVVCENKAIFKSLDTNTILTVALAIVDDNE